MLALCAAPLPPLSRALYQPERYSPRDAMPDYSHLNALESQSVFIIREALHKLPRLGALWSMGKDSSVLLWLVRKACLGAIPIPCLHVDTSYKIPQMITFRDALARAWGLDLRVGRHDAAIDAGATFPAGACERVQCCATLKSAPLQQLIQTHGLEAILLGIRRDEEATRAKERYFSPRSTTHAWRVDAQPPELWDHHQAQLAAGEHMRVHPLLHWTELNVWEYIDREQIPVVPLYFAQAGRRYRSLGCAPCTAATPSLASTVPEIIEELRHTQRAERGNRAQDQASEDAFERLRLAGYM